MLWIAESCNEGGRANEGWKIEGDNPLTIFGNSFDRLLIKIALTHYLNEMLTY